MEYNAFDLTAKLNYKPRFMAKVRWWFKRRKYIKERAKNGWSRYDVWDFDTYLAMVISGAMEYLAEKHMSHPHDYTPEEWSEKLKTISDCFKAYITEPECPAYKAYHEAVTRIHNKDGSISVSAPTELLHAWREEEKRNYENKMKKLKEGFDLLYEVYPNLWD